MPGTGIAQDMRSGVASDTDSDWSKILTLDSDMNTDEQRTNVSAHLCLSPLHQTHTYLSCGLSVMTRN